jgi:uncharacterized membrane protein
MLAGMRVRMLSLAVTSGLFACAGPSGSSDTGAEACGGLSYDSFGAAFLTTYCRTCHSSGAADRRGAPVGVDFDSEADAVGRAADIRRTVLEDGSMPVGGGVTALDRERLEAWLGCLP